MGKMWDKTIALYVEGVKPLLFHLQRYIKAQRPSVISLKVIVYKDGYFLLKCSNTEDIEVILNGEPYYMGGRAALVKKWDSEFDFHRDMLKEVSVWIRLHGLPLNC